MAGVGAEVEVLYAVIPKETQSEDTNPRQLFDTTFYRRTDVCSGLEREISMVVDPKRAEIEAEEEGESAFVKAHRAIVHRIQDHPLAQLFRTGALFVYCGIENTICIEQWSRNQDGIEQRTMEYRESMQTLDQRPKLFFDGLLYGLSQQYADKRQHRQTEETDGEEKETETLLIVIEDHFAPSHLFELFRRAREGKEATVTVGKGNPGEPITLRYTFTRLDTQRREGRTGKITEAPSVRGEEER
ncbi:hypothetical protein HYS48_01370 [Candidatus Woesearchaeota archaeon]|nr:hypothetical protein [Candidatus Woesearchaeota archaeon]